ncbi:MAG: rRNA maturation RNase YbeY [Spirochaetia bacterium]|nr:rRNA maturation RNase YbeY [Spirochaetia bacterium]
MRKFVLDVLSFTGKDKWELSILFCDDQFIHTLNKNYRNKDEATDVLTFAQMDLETEFPTVSDRFNAGDVAISLETLEKNSEYFNVSVNDELKRLLVHGILHLSGMDHANNDPDQEMLVYQEKILAEFPQVMLI